MKVAGWIFKGAGIWGLLALLPLYFLEDHLGREFPPAINHPEFYYGVVGVAVAWQVAFLVIGGDPARYRPLMPAAMIEKFTFAGALIALHVKGRVPAIALVPGIFDGLLGVLFVCAWFNTGPGSTLESSPPNE